MSCRCEASISATLRKWLTEDTAFKAEYDAARSAMFEAGMSRIQVLTARAVETLEDLLGPKKHPSVRLGAARTLVEIGMHEHDATTLMRKLTETADPVHERGGLGAIRRSHLFDTR